jgi:peroxiredoxin
MAGSASICAKDGLNGRKFCSSNRSHKTVRRKTTSPVAIAMLLVSPLLLTAGVRVAAASDALPNSPPVAAELTPVDLDFSLRSTAGTSFDLRTPFDARLRVICFLGCECPVAKLYGPRLQALAERFAPDDVEFIGINSNPQDSMDKLVRYASASAIRFPMLKDDDGTVAERLGATRTPEVFVIDPPGRVIYRGRIDDQYRPGVVTDAPQREDLREAIVQFLQGQPVSVPVTAAAGCLIAKRRPVDSNARVTFAGQVSRVLNRHCVECHRPGEIGPFALTDYEEVVGWADMILEVVADNRMPPWHADETHGSFRNTRLMPEEDKQLLRTWVEAGTPLGNASELPPPPAFASGWQLPEPPELILPMRQTPFTVPAGGTVDYQYFVVDPGFSEDRWVTAAEIIPGNRSVVHHGIVFIRPPDGVRLDGVGWLTAYVPGQRLPPPSNHLARRVPAGSKLVFQMHYTPTGQVQQDLSQLGLIFAPDEQVTEELISLIGINQGLEIPPHEADVSVVGETTSFPAGSQLLAISPHMHLRGKSFQVYARGGDARRILLDVPHYDFNWQHTYILETPLPLSDFDVLEFTATYDNSAANPFNPDPNEFVTWGDQTWEEMAIVFYEVSRPRQREHAAGREAVSLNRSAEIAPPAAADPNHQHQEMADAFFRDLDSDGDGLIRYEEVNRAVQLRIFHQIDTNGDQIIDRQELLDYLRRTR